MKRYLERLYGDAAEHNRRNILRALPPSSGGALLDLGCDDGAWSLEVARAMGARAVIGVEIVAARAALAREKGVGVHLADLARPLPLAAESFEVVHANQVIEHVPDVDVFAAEIFRVLKPGGRAVISTENAASWHNVFALTLGWQMFSLSNMSERRLGIGNPLALHRGEDNHLKSWTHKVVFSYAGLREFFEAHGFADVRVEGAGYYPLPEAVSRFEPRHAHFLTLTASKPRR